VNVLIVSGIWPPDVGGPASHAPELAEFLIGRGHGVEVVTTAESAPAPEPYPVRWTDRRLPRGVRHADAALKIARAARRADVVYTTGMLVRSSLASALARRPVVMKLTSDPAYERSLRYELFSGGLDEFQRAEGGKLRVLRRVNDVALRRAAHLVVPSDALRQLAIRWGIEPERVTLLPNPVSAPEALAPRAELRARHGLTGPTLAFAGRLVPQKSIDVALRALARADGVTLVLAGEGGEADRMGALAQELGLGDRARFLGAQPRATVFELLAAADAALLSSSWENFPHMVVEALAVGTPVISTNVGGVGEIVRDGVNGLLVEIGDVDGLTAAIERYLGDEKLQERLRAATAESIERFAPEGIYGRLEQILARAAAR
jgi:glycosyltransferase involved in cell wall biosynthesis